MHVMSAVTARKNKGIADKCCFLNRLCGACRRILRYFFPRMTSFLTVDEYGASVRIRDKKRQDPKFGSCRNVIQGSVVAGKVDAVVGMVSGEPYFT